MVIPSLNKLASGQVHLEPNLPNPEYLRFNLIYFPI
jgi:hypothetical protein